MLSVPFYHSLFRKYVIIFGSLFSNIRIERLNTAGDVVAHLKVPIAYGPQEKYLARVTGNPDGIATEAVLLPRMAFQVTGISYDATRKLQTTRTVMTANNITGVNVYKKAYTPVPYDIDFELSIMAKNTEDMTRIVEQILPYFTPEWTISAKLLDDFAQLTDIPILIGNITIQDTYDEAFTERRTLVYTINFTMKGYLYGPVTQSKLIKISDINYNIPIDINTPVNQVSPVEIQTGRPGLDANGNPTSLLANTIPYSQINETDPYGYIVTKNIPATSNT
jgi:hypothetical protein